MHIPTHLFSGWICGNLVPSFGPRERFLCMVAATAPDLDGLTLIAGWKCYHDWHHVLLHNLPFAFGLALLLALFSRPRWLAFAVYFGLAHLHYAMDALGSGEGWGIDYLRPFSPTTYFADFGWAFFSWQNYLAAFLTIAASIGIVLLEKADDSRISDAEAGPGADRIFPENRATSSR